MCSSSAALGDETVGGMSIWSVGTGPLLSQDWCQCQCGWQCKCFVCCFLRLLEVCN